MAAEPEDRPRGRVTSFSIRRPVAIMALASVVIVLGMFFVDRLPVDLLPHVEYPHIRVTVNHPGTSPEVMEEQVTRVLERNLAATENLTRIYSRASEGRTNVNLLFEYGTNLDLALQDAARHLELARTQLPDDFESLRLYKYDPSQDPIWEAGFSSTVRSETAVRDWVEHQLAPQLIAIHGISSVEASGGQERELEVILDQERVRGYGLSLAAISATLEDENREVAGGWVTSDTFDVMAKTEGLFTSEADVRNVLIPLPGPQSAHVRLGELAEVRDGHREQRLFIRLDGTPAARVSVFKLPDANTVESVDSVRATLERLERSGFIPEDIQWEVVSDSAPVHPWCGQFGGYRRDPGRRAGDAGGVPVSRQSAQELHYRVVDPDRVDGDLRHDGPGRAHPEHHQPRRARAGGGAVARQRHRDAGEHRPPSR